ncbi:MAG: hypothetical protein ACMUIP_04945 [bacterium]
MGPNWLVLRRLYHNPVQAIVTVEAADELKEEEGTLLGVEIPGTPTRPVSTDIDANAGAVATGDTAGSGTAGGAAITGRKGWGPKSLGPITGSPENGKGEKKNLF